MQLVSASDNLIYYLGLKDNIGGAYITNATIVATVYDTDGLTVLGTVTLANVAGALTVNGTSYADGNYRGQLPYSTALVAGSIYTVQWVITSGSNQTTDVQTVPCLRYAG